MPLSLANSPAVVDVTSGPAPVTFTLCASDETGIAGSPSFYLEPRLDAVPDHAFQHTAGTRQNGCFTGTIVLPQGVAPGVWVGSGGGDLIDDFGNRVGPNTVLREQSLTVVSSGVPTAPPVVVTPPPVTPSVPVDIDSEFSIIDYGSTVLVAAFGRVGARADLYGNGKLIRSGGGWRTRRA